MVLAFAVLLLQVGVAQADAPAPPADATTATVAKDASAPRLPNLDNIKLGDAPSLSDRASSSAPLKTVAYNDSQNSQSLSTIRVPEGKTPKESDIKYAETYSSRQWLALSVVQSAASGFDAYSTRYAVGHGAIEEDPLMRPFAHSPSIYAVSQLCPVALDFLARRMQRSPNAFLRRMWWLPQTTSTGVYILSGVHNIHVANQMSH